MLNGRGAGRGGMVRSRSEMLARRCLEAIWIGHFFHRNWWYLMDVALGNVALLAHVCGVWLDSRSTPTKMNDATRCSISSFLVTSSFYIS